MNELGLEAIRLACRRALPSDEARQIESAAIRQAVLELFDDFLRTCRARATEDAHRGPVLMPSVES